MQFQQLLLAALASVAYAYPQQIVSGAEVTGTTCIDQNLKLDSHDTNVAILSICGGIAGAITKCQGNPTSTTGQSGTSRFELNPVNAGATLNVSKGRWERCVKAAKLTCPQGSFESTCVGGTSDGDFNFSLAAAQ
ncbi:hypothetical protein BDW02DRAFT_565423 [Decorospora gaudefroyi]|uniref:Uncharacterized protein n=1 Tax=Decorospora gaudefroyi TaxID=184978 RepID=A0A6A5KRP4_9PLEO|nr:hypothetical protein BDW02DRAFT_565423 [Decorospora gaudefroyi]